ncbi:MAG: hypothetical protein WD981_02225 [Gaiellaceae bacterium]
MARLDVLPRDTPEERADGPVAIDVDEDLSVHAEIIEDWTSPRQNWDFYLREGHEFGRPNNVEGHLAFIAGEQTSTLMFRLDQLDAAEDFGEELVLRFEERDGVAKTARLTANGLEVELFHILTYT